MEEKIQLARNHVLQAIAYYEQCGETPDYGQFKNDAANIYGDTYEEYSTIYAALDKEF